MLAILGALLAFASISITPTFTGRIASLDGAAISGALVAYSYSGSRFNFVDSLTYERPGDIVRTDGEGAFRIPGVLHLHRPLDGRLEPRIEWVYAPELHHAFGPIARLTESRPGVLEVDWKRGLVRLADLTEDPERRQLTIDFLGRVGRIEDAAEEARALLERR